MCPDPSSPRRCTRAVGHSGDCTLPKAMSSQGYKLTAASLANFRERGEKNLGPFDSGDIMLLVASHETALARVAELELELGRLQRQICDGPGIFGDDTTDEELGDQPTCSAWEGPCLRDDRGKCTQCGELCTQEGAGPNRRSEHDAPTYGVHPYADMRIRDAAYARERERKEELDHVIACSKELGYRVGRADGAAVAFGIIGMAEAIWHRELERRLFRGLSETREPEAEHE